MNKLDFFLGAAVTLGLTQPGCLAPDAKSCDESPAIVEAGTIGNPTDAQIMCLNMDCGSGSENVGVRCKDDGGKYSFTSCGQIEDLQGTAVNDIKKVLDGGGTCMTGFEHCADGIAVLTSNSLEVDVDAISPCEVAEGSCEIPSDKMGYHCPGIDEASLEITCHRVLDNVVAAFEGVTDLTECEGYISN